MDHKKQNQIADETDEMARDKALLQERKELKSSLYSNCFYTAAKAISNLYDHGHALDCSILIKNLIESSGEVSSGTLKEVEHMLMTQAKSLEHMFYDALTKLPNSSMEHAEVFANIALRAQASCRKTLMALAELKHPRRTTFIKQQNNAITQQVNEVKSNPKNFEKVANELLEINYEQRLDAGTTASSITTDSAMATMEICRSKNSQRKSN